MDKLEAVIDRLHQRISDLKHALGEDADWFDRAKSAERERDQLRLDMVSQHKIVKDMVKRHNEETCRLLAEIEAWKTASGLEKGGDPDGVTPDDLRNEIEHLRAAQEKSWTAADEAMCAQYEDVIRDMVDACDRLMGDSDLPDDDSPEMKAMQRATAILMSGRARHLRFRTHAMVIPWPISQGLHTWCSYRLDDPEVLKDNVAAVPEAVTCEGCKRAMHDGLVQLTQWVPRLKRVPDGTPGIRDQNAPCDLFVTGVPDGDCEGDGHYLCEECEKKNAEDDDEDHG